MRLHQGHSGPNQGPTNLKPPRNEEELGTEEEKRGKFTRLARSDQ
ncbi:hypothetical protein PROFUN_16984 [Planoprotostelium fungivorum]|uniref:Uncharacterized protein n=1 Tax=Planoprotostelium fungivorum TaxID=1890364 RepID=A0A2P6MMM9_9EUKA|nr:hypothetical protein PROFUN_16984 [Planoprotostelium fungivorum]